MNEVSKCLGCGAALMNNGGVLYCRYCGSMYEQKTMDGENSYDLHAAYDSLKRNVFDEAEDKFGEIISKSPDCYEAYWGRAIARFGITFVDGSSGKKKPTCNRIDEKSFIDDRDFKQAIEIAPPEIAGNYREHAEQIEKVRTLWLEKASHEPPYDVFICYKRSDKAKGIARTDDSEQMLRLYTFLTKNKINVFFAEETLKQHLAEEYEPYIYNALRTSKVLILYGQNPEYFSAPWVKNEWQRFARLIDEKKKEDNSLVVAYEKMSSADLPLKLRQYQAMDAAEKDFYPNIIDHIKKVIDACERSQVKRKSIIGRLGKKAKSVGEEVNLIDLGDVKIEKKPVLKSDVIVRTIGEYKVREVSLNMQKKIDAGFSNLEKGNFSLAKSFFEDIIKENEKEDAALFGLMLLSLKVKNDIQFVNSSAKFKNFIIFHKMMECCSQETANKRLDLFKECMKKHFNENNVGKALEFFSAITMYEDQAVELSGYIMGISLKYIKTAPKLAEVILDALLKVYPPERIDDHIMLREKIIKNCLPHSFVLSQKYSDDLISIDEGNAWARYVKILLSVKAVDSNDFAVKIKNFKSINLIDDFVSNVERRAQTEYLEYLMDVIYKSLVSGESARIKMAQNIFSTIFKYNVDERMELINLCMQADDEPCIDEINFDSFPCKVFKEFFAELYKAIPSKSVDEHLHARGVFANMLMQRVEEDSVCAKAIIDAFDDILSIDEGQIDVLWLKMWAKLGIDARFEDSIISVLNKFSDFESFEKLLSYADDEKDFEYIEQFCNLYIRYFALGKSSDKDRENFEKLVKYYDESRSEAMVNALNSAGNTLVAVGKFKDAKILFMMAANEDGSSIDALWGLVRCKLKVKDEIELILDARKLDFFEYNEVVKCAYQNDDEKNKRRFENLMTINGDLKKIIRRKSLPPKARIKHCLSREVSMYDDDGTIINAPRRIKAISLISDSPDVFYTFIRNCDKFDAEEEAKEKEEHRERVAAEKVEYRENVVKEKKQRRRILYTIFKILICIVWPFTFGWVLTILTAPARVIETLFKGGDDLYVNFGTYGVLPFLKEEDLDPGDGHNDGCVGIIFGGLINCIIVGIFTLLCYTSIIFIPMGKRMSYMLKSEYYVYKKNEKEQD